MELITKKMPNLPWEMDVLRALEQASNDLNIDIWGSTGLFYRPFLNGKFGPHQLGMDKDVCVERIADVATVYQYLEMHFPSYRWSVYSGEQKDAFYGFTSPHGAVQVGRSISMRVGAVRLDEGQPLVLTTRSALQALSDGIIEINDFARSQIKDSANFAESAHFRGKKLYEEYPGLSLGSEYIRMFGEDHSPSPVSYTDIVYAPPEKHPFRIIFAEIM